MHLAEAGSIALPGRGLTLAWAPDGRALAVGGHFRDPTTGLRYDTRVADVASRTLVRSFACHYFWVVSTAWVENATGTGANAIGTQTANSIQPNTGPSRALNVKFKKLTTPVAVPLYSGGFASLITV